MGFTTPSARQAASYMRSPTRTDSCAPRATGRFALPALPQVCCLAAGCTCCFNVSSQLPAACRFQLCSDHGVFGTPSAVACIFDIHAKFDFNPSHKLVLHYSLWNWLRSRGVAIDAYGPAMQLDSRKESARRRERERERDI